MNSIHLLKKYDITYRNRILRCECEPADMTDLALKELINDMRETLCLAGGSGLVAPQVDRALNVFIVNSRNTFLKWVTD